MEIKELIRENIIKLSPYSTARDEFQGELEIGVYLDANENPYNNRINRYPDPYQVGLKRVIASLKGVKSEQLFLGNGSDEAIDLIIRIFCTPQEDGIAIIKPSYGMYQVAAQVNDINCLEIALDENFDISADEVFNCIEPNVKVIFLCSPNNPTGNLLNKEEVKRIISRFQGIVVVDEAYIDFSTDEGFLPYLEQFNNLIILQTLSKAWGMAGLRIGMAIASAEIISYMNKVKHPYNINQLAQDVGIKELTDRSELKLAERNEIIQQRDQLTKQLAQYKCIKRIYPSHANFILIKCCDADALYQYLIQEGGVIVRNRSSAYGCSNTLRITIGTPSENEKLMKLLSRFEQDGDTQKTTA